MKTQHLIFQIITALLILFQKGYQSPDYGAHLKFKFSSLGVFNITNGQIKKSSIVTHLNSRFTKF